MHAAAIYADSTNDGPEIGTLVVIVDRAKNLPNRKSTKQNPYCQARLGKTCNKTKTDHRGGQTPRWYVLLLCLCHQTHVLTRSRDEELRFTVHDSPDYYTLKLSIFNDDKKTDLICDGWVDLNKVIIPGGGQSDLWQDLQFRRKYAGEARIELTFYDSRPKVEKPAPRRGSARDMPGDIDTLSGPRQFTPVKRRPLPSNPGSNNSTPDLPRLHATGPRQFGTPPSLRGSERAPPEARRDTVSSISRQPIDPRRQTSSRLSEYNSIADQEEYFGHDPYPPSPQEYSPQPDQESYPEDMNGHYQMYNNDPSEQVDYPRNVRPSSRHRSMQPFEDMPAHPQFHHSHSAPGPEEFHHHPEGMVLRRSMTEAQDEFNNLVHQNEWTGRGSFGPDHPDSFTEIVTSHGYQSQPLLDQASFHHPYDHNDIDGGPVGNHDDYEDDIPPPPPPTHRYTGLQLQSSPAYNRQQEEWDQQQHDQSMQWSVPRKGLYERGHLASRSEASLPHFRGATLEHRSSDLEYQQQRQPYINNLENEPNQHNRDVRLQRQSRSPQPLYHDADYGYQNSSSKSTMAGFQTHDANQPYNHDHEDPCIANIPSEAEYGNLPSQGTNSNALYRPSAQTYPAPTPLPHNDISPRSSPYGANGSLPQAQYTPTRPHPLSQQHTLSSSPHHRSSPYDGIPLIKPLAISPNKLKLETPKSQDRYYKAPGMSPITRKSVSPHPASAEPSNAFSAAYSPDSFDALNPAIAKPSTNNDSTYHNHSEGPIIDFHGNVVDPSDRLPETSWAPEPLKKSPTKDPSDTLPISSWATELDHIRSAPSRTIKVRVRDRLNGSRDLEQRHSYGPGSSPANRTTLYTSSPLISSPVDASPTGRNRLVKKYTRPQSMAPMSSWDQPIRDVPLPPINSSPYSGQSGPAVPAKVPLDSGRPDVGVQFTNSPTSASRDDPFLMNAGMGRLQIENSVPRRIGGRRLLGFGG